jgi:ribosomal protein L37E
LTLARGWLGNEPPCSRCGRPSPYSHLHGGHCLSCGLSVYSFQDRKHRKSQIKRQRKFPS